MTSISCHTRIATRVISKMQRARLPFTSGRHPSPPAEKFLYLSAHAAHSALHSSAQKSHKPTACISLPAQRPHCLCKADGHLSARLFQHHLLSLTSVTSLAVPHCWVEASLPYSRPPKAPGAGACTYQSIASHSCRMCYQGQALMIYFSHTLKGKKPPRPHKHSMRVRVQPRKTHTATATD